MKAIQRIDCAQLRIFALATSIGNRKSTAPASWGLHTRHRFSKCRNCSQLDCERAPGDSRFRQTNQSCPKPLDTRRLSVGSAIEMHWLAGIALPHHRSFDGMLVRSSVVSSDGDNTQPCSLLSMAETQQRYVLLMDRKPGAEIRSACRRRAFRQKVKGEQARSKAVPPLGYAADNGHSRFGTAVWI